MDATLVTVTVLSMSMAAALSAIVWRMLRLERQRSNARVAALTTAALGHQADESGGRTFRPDEDDLPLVPSDVSEGGLAAHSFGEGGLFVEPARESPWGARFAVMAALALVVASVVLFSLAAHTRTASRQSVGAPLAAQVSAGASAKAELELMSLHDSRQTTSLTITGLVQNPRTG